MNILFLDDNPVRCKMFLSEVPSAEITHTAEECIDTFKSCPPEVVWDFALLDHDLGNEMFVDSGRPDCGMEVVRWIMENKPKVNQFIVHSHNVPAANRMVSLLLDAGYPCYHKPFCYQIGTSCCTLGDYSP